MELDHKFLCTSANDKKIIYDHINSHTATHLHDAPELKALVVEYLTQADLDGELIAKDVDMGKIIGNSDVVTIDSKDVIIYAIRKNREDQGFVPFTKSQSAQPSSLLSVYLVQKDDNTYELSSTWIGEFDSPMFPQMDNATEESIPYWSSHAFVWGSQEIIPGTERSDCPWQVTSRRILLARAGSMRTLRRHKEEKHCRITSCQSIIHETIIL